MRKMQNNELKHDQTMTYNVAELEVTPEDWVPKNSIIKVIGVGGGGCNAVNYMYNRRIEGCTFIVCNTDKQSLDKSPVPIKIQLGSGLGAGCNPTEGRIAAQNAQKEIEEKVRAMSEQAKDSMEQDYEIDDDEDDFELRLDGDGSDA